MNVERLIRLLISQLKVAGACSAVSGDERTLPELVKLLVSPQGIEFCLKNKFPSIETFRQFKRFDVEQYDVYIDKGEITLDNKNTVVLIGNTTATVNCGNLARYQVILLRGAKAVVNASGWAVVRVEADADCECIKYVENHAKIL